MMNAPFPITGFVALCLSVSVCSGALAAAGDMDASFGTGGLAYAARGVSPHYSTGFAPDVSTSMALQSDGKIVMAGYSHPQNGYSAVVARFNADGTPDDSFGQGGRLVQHSGEPIHYCEKVAVQNDGKILLAGSTQRTGDGLGSHMVFIVARYTPEGVLDKDFGEEGTATARLGSFSNDTASLSDMVILGDGRLLVAGNYSDSGTSSSVTYDPALVCYRPDGSLDTGFGEGGRVLIKRKDGLGGAARRMAMQADSKTVVAGINNMGRGKGGLNFFALRYHADGSVDTGFGGGGRVTTGIGPESEEQCYGLALQDDGKIILGGSTQNVSLQDFALVRYMPDGSLDTAFGQGGKVVTDMGGDVELITGVTVQSDGKIIATGTSNFDRYTERMVLLRYNPDGTLDNTFGGGGRVTVGAGPHTSLSANAEPVLREDGMLVIAGYSGEPVLDARFAVARVQTAGETTRTFTVSPPGNAPGGAVMQAVFNPGGGAAEVFFQVRSTGSPIYTDIPASTAFVSGEADVQLSALANLILWPGEYVFRLAARTGASTAYSPDIQFTYAVPQKNLPESWRLAWFGSPENSGDGADDNDYDRDGLTNLLERACATNPKAAGDSAYSLAVNGAGNPEFIYSRSASARGSGDAVYSVEWAESLSGPWMTEGVSENAFYFDGDLERVKATVSAEGAAAKRFLRLRVTVR